MGSSSPPGSSAYPEKQHCLYYTFGYNTGMIPKREPGENQTAGEFNSGCLQVEIKGKKRKVMLELLLKLNVNSQEIDCINGCRYTGGQRSVCSFSEGSVLLIDCQLGLFSCYNSHSAAQRD